MVELVFCAFCNTRKNNLVQTSIVNSHSYIFLNRIIFLAAKNKWLFKIMMRLGYNPLMSTSNPYFLKIKQMLVFDLAYCDFSWMGIAWPSQLQTNGCPRQWRGRGWCNPMIFVRKWPPTCFADCLEILDTLIPYEESLAQLSTKKWSGQVKPPS